MASSNEDSDDLAKRATAEIRQEMEAGMRVNVPETARQYRVSRFRVARRLKGLGGRSDRGPVNYQLSETQEAALLQSIRTMDEIGLGLC